MSGLKTTVFDLYDFVGSTLWVEDDLTRAFLTEIWQDPQIRILSAPGKDAVKHLMNAVPLDKRGKRVVGLVDLDLDVPSDWHDPNKFIVTTAVHEFENYLLDFDILGSLAQETPSDIELVAKTYANQILWWMACKHSLRDMKRNMSVDFPKDPSLGPMTQDDAIKHICAAGYPNELKKVSNHFTESDIAKKVAHHGQQYADDLASPDAKWKRTFSGKEIFRHVRANMSGFHRFDQQDLTPAQRDENLAMRMARELRKPRFRQCALQLHFDAWKVALKQRA